MRVIVLALFFAVTLGALAGCSHPQVEQSYPDLSDPRDHQNPSESPRDTVFGKDGLSATVGGSSSR